LIFFLNFKFLQAIHDIQEKNKVKLEAKYLIPLLNLSSSSLRAYLMRYIQDKITLSFCLDFQQRIRVVSEELEVIPQTVHQLFEEHQILLTKPLQELQELFRLIKSEGKVNAKELCQDIWVMRHNYERMKSRIEKTNELQIAFRPWMGRCNERSFQVRCERQVLQKSILGGRTLAEFISQRLDVPLSDVQRLVIDSDKIDSVSVEKLNKVLDFLLEQKVERYTILHNIKMTEFSTDTLLKRIQQLRRVFGDDEHFKLIPLDRRSYERRFLTLAQRHSKLEQAKKELRQN
jgi:hypothetical protein